MRNWPRYFPASSSHRSSDNIGKGAGGIVTTAAWGFLLQYGEDVHHTSIVILTLFADGRPAKRCEVMTFSHIDAQHPVCPPIAASRCTRTDFDSCQPGTITNAR